MTREQQPLNKSVLTYFAPVPSAPKTLAATVAPKILLMLVPSPKVQVRFVIAELFELMGPIVPTPGTPVQKRLTLVPVTVLLPLSEMMIYGTEESRGPLNNTPPNRLKLLTPRFVTRVTLLRPGPTRQGWRRSARSPSKGLLEELNKARILRSLVSLTSREQKLAGKFPGRSFETATRLTRLRHPLRRLRKLLVLAVATLGLSLRTLARPLLLRKTVT